MVNFFTRSKNAIFGALKGSHFLGFGFLLTIMHISSGALGYVFQILVGRMLSPDDFAVFSSLMASFMFLGAPVVAMTLLVSRRVSILYAHKTLYLAKALLLRINKILLMLSVLFLIIFWLLAPYIREYMRLPGLLPLILFEAILLLSIFNAVNSAFFQGLQKFIMLGILGLTGISLKILISGAFIYVGLGLSGALLGAFLSLAIVFAYGLWALLRNLPAEVCINTFHFKVSAILQTLPVLSAAVAAAAMTQLDMVLVNWFFSSKEAGLYAAASVLGKAILYLPGGLVLVLYPVVSARHSKGEGTFQIFCQAVTATIISCGSVALTYWRFGDEIIDFFYGPSYRGAGEILKWYGFAILPMTIVIVAEQYLIARGQVLFAWIFLAVAPFQILAIYLWHEQLLVVLLIMGIFGSLLAFIGYIFMRIQIKN